MDIALMIRKAEVLEQTADHLEQNIDQYNWHSAPACNCGFLAQVATGLTEGELRLLKSREFLDGKLESGDWETIALQSPVCRHTGIPVSKILSSMTSIGFTLEEIASIEDLSNERLLDQACQSLGIKNDEYSGLHQNPQVVTAYFRAWARELRDQIARQSVQAFVPMPAKPKASQSIPVQVHL